MSIKYYFIYNEFKILQNKTYLLFEAILDVLIYLHIDLL